MMAESEVFCDYLSVTYSPDDNPSEEFSVLLYLIGGLSCDWGNDRRDIIRLGATPEDALSKFGGQVTYEKGNGWFKISLSGKALSFIRESGLYNDVLALLSSSPHKVTRLDATIDVYADAPPLLRGLLDKYPDGRVSLGRKALCMQSIMSVRNDGASTGTVSIGYGSRARVTARVYDKQHEANQVRGEIIPPTTRYEITIRDGLCTLHDALKPTAVFWHYASPSFLDAPDNPPVWESHGHVLGWTYQRPKILPMSRLRTLVETDPGITTMEKLADDMGEHGRLMLLRLLARRLGVSSSVIGADHLAKEFLGAESASVREH